MFTETTAVSAVSDPRPITATPRVEAPPAKSMGVGRFFGSQNFHFQTLRALMESPSGSADTNEVLETVKLIADGDVESWYTAWSALAERVLALAESTSDKLSKGNAYMRAYNYQRTAEFLLPPEDTKRPPSGRSRSAISRRG